MDKSIKNLIILIHSTRINSGAMRNTRININRFNGF